MEYPSGPLYNDRKYGPYVEIRQPRKICQEAEGCTYYNTHIVCKFFAIYVSLNKDLTINISCLERGYFFYALAKLNTYLLDSFADELGGLLKNLALEQYQPIFEEQEVFTQIIFPFMSMPWLK